MNIESYGASDIGLVRLSNEDVWAHVASQNFFILADGMGGHQAGEIAAHETVLKLCQWAQKLPASLSQDTLSPLLERAIADANLWVYTLSTQNREMAGMGTTLCLAFVINHTLLYAHVGDSRLYRVRKGRIARLTIDHSLKSARGDGNRTRVPYRNVLTRAVGTQPNVLADIHSEEVVKGDVYFLCSDGLTDNLSDDDILETIENASSVKEATDALIDEAKQRGGSDNITIVMFKIA